MYVLRVRATTYFKLMSGCMFMCCTNFMFMGIVYFHVPVVCVLHGRVITYFMFHTVSVCSSCSSGVAAYSCSCGVRTSWLCDYVLHVHAGCGYFMFIWCAYSCSCGVRTSWLHDMRTSFSYGIHTPCSCVYGIHACVM